MAATDHAIQERLVKGAAVLGRLWREGNRCEMTWAQVCTCAAKSVFCTAKEQWVALFDQLMDERKLNPGISEEREIGAGIFGIVEAMTSAELSASGLTLTLEVDGIGKVKVGPKGDTPWEDFVKCNGEVLKTVMEVLKHFPGARVV